jgi:plasmid stabilization system protein ParE
VNLRPAAAADLLAAYDWYESQRPGLGDEFLAAVAAALRAVDAAPQCHPVVYRKTRRLLVRRFPYGLLYRLDDRKLILVACFHGSRDPRRWMKRIREEDR